MMRSQQIGWVLSIGPLALSATAEFAKYLAVGAF
jgi:hypothetical protein